MADTEILYIYASKVKIIMIFMGTLVFTVFGAFIGKAAFDLGDFGFMILGIGIALLFGALSLAILIKLFSVTPYLILTKEALVTNASSKKAVPIHWKDIDGYRVRHIYFSTAIEILLYDEEKYRSQMSTATNFFSQINKVVDASLFAIGWGLIKRKDRAKLVRALENGLAWPTDVFADLVPELADANVTKVTSVSRIDKDYLLKSYGASIIIALCILLFLYFVNEKSSYTRIFMLFLLYPFAKIPYDLLIGFNIKTKIEKQSFMTIHIYQLHYFIHLFIYIFSLYLAPIGLLFLIVRAVYCFVKRRQ